MPQQQQQQQRGVVCTRCGPYNEVLAVRDDVDVPEVGPGLVKVRVLAAGIAFPDVLVVEGKHMMKRTPPFVPASELCGVIVEIGEDCSSGGGSGADAEPLRVGTRVFGTAISGSLSEYALMRDVDCYPVPAGVRSDVCAGFEINYGTAWHALKHLAKLQEGETVLVLGASGGVGMAAIDICRAAGAEVVACASTDAKLEQCASAGATVLVNYSNGDFKKKLKQAGVYGNVDVVFDPVGGDLSEVCMRALGWGGRFLVIGFAAGGATPRDAIPKFPLNLALLNERQILGCFWGAWKMQDGGEANRECMAEMMHLVEEGKLRPVLSDKVYRLENAVEAMDLLMHRKVVGKVVVQVADAGTARL